MIEEHIKLSVEEVNAEKINTIANLKIFLYSLAIIPLTVLTQIWFTLSESIKIPNSVVDSLVFHEKMKQLLRRKHSANLQL